MAKKKNEIVAAQENALVVAEFDEDDFDQGFEDSRDDFAMPKLILLQSKSPQCEEDGMKLGSLYDNVAEEEVPNPSVNFVPVYRDHVFVEKTDDAARKYIATHSLNSEVVALAKETSEKFGQYYTAAGNKLEEKFVIYALDGVTGQPFAFDVKGLSMKHYKKWRSRLGKIMVARPDGSKKAAPFHSHLCTLTTDKEKTENGVFSVFNFAAASGTVRDSVIDKTNPLFGEAKAMRNLVKGGGVKVQETERDEPSDDGDGDGAF